MIDGICIEKQNISGTKWVKVGRFLKSIASSKSIPFLAFLIPLGVRAIPEILMGSFVVGYDPLGYYIPYTLTWLSGSMNFWSFFGTSPLIYIILMGGTSIGIPIVLLLKILSPLLLACLGLVVYFYANKTLSWSPKKSLLVVLFATLYFVALRISWDMLRTELALIFLFITMIYLEKNNHPSLLTGVLLSTTMLFVVFSHQLIAVIMFAIIITKIIYSHVKKKTNTILRIFISSFPALILFSTIVFADLQSGYSLASSFSQYSGEPNALLGPISYGDFLVNTIGFFVFCYLPLMPLLFLGYKHFKSNLQLKTWIVLLFALIFSILIGANVFFGILPYRLILLMTFPFSFYAAEAFSSLRLKRYKVFAGFILATLSMFFIVLPYDSSFAYFALFPTYVPRSMLMNTVPQSDCQDTANAMQWASHNLPDDSRLLVHSAFYGWASLSLNADQIIPYGFNNPDVVVQELMKNSSSYQYYLIWWTNRSGWFGQPELSSDFIPIFQMGKISIFRFNNSLTIDSATDTRASNQLKMRPS